MNNQEKQANGKHADGLSKRRLFLKKAGVAAPVLLTLTSPSVFGLSDLCLSQQLSGTHSGTALLCNTGANPVTVLGALTTDEGNRLFNGEFGAAVGGNPNFSAILTAYAGDLTTYKLEAYFVTALLNAEHAGGGAPYILTSSQVLGLYSGAPVPPAYADIYAFLEATWRTA